MRYLLDTNTCIRYMNGRSVAISQRLNAMDKQDAAVCSIVKAELFYGAMRSNNPAKTLVGQQEFLSHFISLPFDDQAAQHYGRIRASLFAKGQPIGPNDLMIAAIALANDLILVTHNVSEFSRVPDLKTEDWEIP